MNSTLGPSPASGELRYHTPMKMHHTLARKLSLWPVLLVCALLIGGTLTPISTAQAQQESPIQMTINAGLDGYCKDSQWMPVRATLENNGENIAGALSILMPTNGAVTEYRQEVTLPSVSRKEIVFNIYYSPSGGSTEIIFTNEKGQRLASERISVTCKETLIGVWAENASYYNELTNINPAQNRAAIAKMTAADFPENTQGLKMLDILVISNVDSGVLSAGQRSAIVDWVRSGGKLVITGGPEWQKTA